MLTKALTIDSYIEKTVHTLLSDGEEADWTTMVRGEIQKILQSECRAREISLALFADAESICECVTAAEMTAILRWCARARSLQALEDGFHPRPADFAEGAQGLYRILTTLTETDQRYVLKTLGFPSEYQKTVGLFAELLPLSIEKRCADALPPSDDADSLKGIGGAVLGQLFSVDDLIKKIDESVKTADSEKYESVKESLERVRSAVIDRLIEGR